MTIGIKAPGYYVQGNGELDKLGKYVKKMGNSFLVLLSPNNKRRIGERIDKALNSANKSVFYAEFQGECSKKAIADAQDIAYQHGCDAIIGVGGGKALDTAKAVATNLGDLPTIIIPTIASNDAPCSSVAVIYNEQGVVIKALMMKHKRLKNIWSLVWGMPYLPILKHVLANVVGLKPWLVELVQQRH